MGEGIFVSVASYRDTEGPVTLQDLYAKADEPGRVFAGVLWQIVPGIDDDCVGLPVGVPCAQVRELRVHATESLGVCWARHRIQTELWHGEEYYLQIDSHMRFIQGWDSCLIGMARRSGSPRPVLSTYPAGYKPGGELGAPLVPVLVAKGFSEQGVLLLRSRNLDPDFLPARPPSSAFCAAGFLFGPGSLVTEVPYDPNVYFHGEEITLAVRLWTHGYDLFSPDCHLVWHDYTADRGRPRHWQDTRDWGALNQRAVARIRHLLGAAPCTDPEALRDLARFGLGSTRTLAEYERFADVSFAASRPGLRALDGRFPQLPPLSQEDTERRRWFGSVYSDNQWGSSATRSGPGATAAATSRLRPALRELLADLGVRMLVDAGCGEFGWMEEIAGSLDLYLGYDIVPQLVERNAVMTQGASSLLFACADITRSVLPRADAILCRHCLTHLPDAEVQQTLSLFRESGSTFLLATVYDSPDGAASGRCGWRALDLAHARFGLGEPLRVMPDLRNGSGCMLAVWCLAGAPVPLARSGVEGQLTACASTAPGAAGRARRVS